MKAFKKIIFLILIGGFLQNCYLGRKVEQPLNIYIDKSAFPIYTTSFVQTIQYLEYNTPEGYQEKFLEALYNEVTYQKNITLVESPEKADYILKLNVFQLTESESSQTVNDANSPYNGQTYSLTKIDSKCDFEIFRNGFSLGKYTANADKEEKLKNNQHLGQIILGTNKDNTIYREKLLQQDVCNDMAAKCGRRTWNLFTQKLVRKIKK